MLTVLFAIIAVFLIVSLFGYIVHWSLHQTWTGSFNQSHMAHHMRLYPPCDYMSEDEYREAGKDDTFYVFAMAALPLLATPIILWILGVISLPLMVGILVEMGFIGWLHDYIHEAFHVTKHWLNRFKIVRQWNYIHYVHHVDMSKNLGIYSFWVDRLLGTFQKKL